MRILHVVPSYFPAIRYGGPIFAIHALCRALTSRGHVVEVFTTSIDGPTNSAVPHDVPVILDGVKVRYFESSYLRRLSWAPSLGRALRREIKGADVVHLHSVFLWPTWVAARVALGSGVPYVVSPRGMLVQKLFEARHRLLKRAWVDLIEKSNLEKAAAVHVTSGIEAADLAEFGFRLRQVVTIPNGVDGSDNVPTRNPADDIRALKTSEPLILFFGRLSWKKGLDVLLHAFAHTQTGTLAIVGTDDENLSPQLSKLARELDIAHRVQFVPRTVTGSDKEHVFASADAFVLPSHSENFGNAALEAMQRGLPVIVSQNVGASEIVRASGGGIIVECDPPQLGAAIKLLAENPALRKLLGEKGQNFVRENYNWPSVAARMEAFYMSLKI